MSGRKRRILFVDDEAAVLGALRDLLRRERHEWEMVFVPGGAEAITAMTLEPFDVVVCDMRMPGMDGAAVLTWVRDHLPAAARIVLSGQASESSVARALPVAHQYLSKPCDAAMLRRAVSRACALQDVLQDEHVRRVIGRASRLASPPATLTALSAAIANPRAGVPELADIVEHDPAMSAKVLQLANSAFFGPAREVTSVRQAVMYLGADMLSGLAATAHLFSGVDLDLPRGFAVDDLQRKAVRRSNLAARLAGVDRDIADAAAAAALLADIGILVLAAELATEYKRALALLDDDCPLHSAEHEVLGVTHAEAGAYLLGIWGLPFRLVEGVALHHRPGAGSEGPSEVVAIVHVADQLIGGPGNGGAAAIDRGALAKAGFADRLVAWETIAAGLETGPGASEPIEGGWRG